MVCVCLKRTRQWIAQTPSCNCRVLIRFHKASTAKCLLKTHHVHAFFTSCGHVGNQQRGKSRGKQNSKTPWDQPCKWQKAAGAWVRRERQSDLKDALGPTTQAPFGSAVGRSRWIPYGGLYTSNVDDEAGFLLCHLGGKPPGDAQC